MLCKTKNYVPKAYLIVLLFEIIVSNKPQDNVVVIYLVEFPSKKIVTADHRRTIFELKIEMKRKVSWFKT